MGPLQNLVPGDRSALGAPCNIGIEPRGKIRLIRRIEQTKHMRPLCVHLVQSERGIYLPNLNDGKGGLGCLCVNTDMTGPIIWAF